MQWPRASQNVRGLCGSSCSLELCVDAIVCKRMLLRAELGRVKHLNPKQLWAQGVIQSFGVSVLRLEADHCYSVTASWKVASLVGCPVFPSLWTTTAALPTSLPLPSVREVPACIGLILLRVFEID